MNLTDLIAAKNMAQEKLDEVVIRQGKRRDDALRFVPEGNESLRGQIEKDFEDAVRPHWEVMGILVEAQAIAYERVIRDARAQVADIKGNTP